ncbi:MAG: acyl carrier protein [Thermoleophilia bacterium]|nr:acyl carrier protein [Thermoleophilia bacterium]
MDRAQALSELQAILVEQLGVDVSEVQESASFAEDLNADSLDLVEMIMEMEDKFGVTIPDEDAEKILTVGDAVDYITRQSGS